MVRSEHFVGAHVEFRQLRALLLACRRANVCVVDNVMVVEHDHSEVVAFI
jgi:hypothetical protein